MVCEKKKYFFREDTAEIRNSEWKANELPNKLKNRNVEITGPGNSKKMIINAFNSHADGYMLDLEDSMTPSWYNVINGHHNIKEAARGELVDYKYDNKGNLIKKYEINNNNKLPKFFTRIRGLHMLEENVLVNDKPVPATIFDMATFMYHNAKYMIENNKGPYLYIPKLESYEDAKFINGLLNQTQTELSIPIGTTKVTCLIETYPAIFQTEEIIYALKDHIVGLNCGRWDYLFSMIKSLPKNHIMPYRDELSMDKEFLEDYVHQIVNSCHKRGILAIGGMSAFIPTSNAEENKKVLEKIKKDKITEIQRGCDGAWVAHPGLVKPIKELFVEKLNGSDNLIHYLPENRKKFNNTPKESDFVILDNDLRKNINQLVGRYWNKGILIGGSDFENYIIEIEILLDRNGNIIGEVRTIQPAIPTGRYAIAFREASNAIKAVGRIPISSEKYQNGLKLKLTFDPASGIGFD